MNTFNGGNNNDMIGNLLDLISIMLGYENLMENREQSAQNDVAKNNQEQSRMLLDDLHSQFNAQNEILKYQNTLLKQILEILKGEENV